MKKKIVILGSTGSIGKTLLNIISKDRKNFEIILLTADTNYKLLYKQAKKFNVKNLIITNTKKFNLLKKINKKKDLNIYNDFKNLKVCLHFVSNKLDTGKIIQINKIKLFKNMKLYQLRSKNAEIAAKILLKFLKNIFNKKKIILKNNNTGRYYSFMPTSIKKIVENKFNNFTKKI